MISKPDLTNICVYCSASNDVDPVYKHAAKTCAEILAAHQKTTIYGGGRGGLMGIIADTALQEGADVIGVMPQDLINREIAYKGLTTLHITPDLQTRQKQMAGLADAFLVLPGGLGTMAEFFEIITWKQLGYHDKPIWFLNTKNYWQPLLSMLDQAKKQRFLHTKNKKLYEIIEIPEELSKFL